jgi:hypothetical protein
VDFPRTTQYSIIVYWLGLDQKEDRAKGTICLPCHTFSKTLSHNQYLSNLISLLQNWNQHSTFKTGKNPRNIQLRVTKQEDNITGSTQIWISDVSIDHHPFSFKIWMIMAIRCVTTKKQTKNHKSHFCWQIKKNIIWINEVSNT